VLRCSLWPRSGRVQSNPDVGPVINPPQKKKSSATPEFWRESFTQNIWVYS
jgi:hypothetical protein